MIDGFRHLRRVKTRMSDRQFMTDREVPLSQLGAPIEKTGFHVKTLKRRATNSRVEPPAPRGGRLCERRELLESLDASLENRVTLVIAPAGYGKTTLLAQWCLMKADSQAMIAYYSASEHDRDPTTFLTMIAHALIAAGVDLGQGSALDDDNVQDDITLDDILLGLELAGQPMALVIDDFERVNDPAITNIMQAFIEHAPPLLHFVIASRTFPNIPLSALELEGKLRMIDTYQLRLRRDELAWMLDLDSTGPEIAEVALQTQGWPVTAELYRLWRQRRGVHDERATFGGHVAEVHNYLAEQLFSSLPKDHLDLLIDIADRPEVSAELADAMRGRDDSASLLMAAAHNMSSLMWTGREHGAMVYRLHPLLLEHLRQRLSQNPRRRQELSIRAAHWYMAEVRYPEAIRAAIDSHSVDTVHHIVGQLRPMHIMVAGGAVSLRTILRELSDDVMQMHPNLQIMAALAHFKGGFFAESRSMIARLREETENFTIDPDGHPDWLLIDGSFVDLIALCQVSRCGPEAIRLHDIVRAAAAQDPVMWGACEIVMMLVHQIHGNFDAAEVAIARARDVYRTIAHSRYSGNQIIGHEMLIHTARGQMRRAMDVIAGYKKESEFDASYDAGTPTLSKLILAVIRYEREYSDHAVETLKTHQIEHRKAESWFDQYAISIPPIATRLFVREGAQAALDYIAEERFHATGGLEALPDFLTFLEIEYLARSGDAESARHLADGIALKACAYGKDDIADLRGWRERDASLVALFRLQMACAEYDEAEETAQTLLKHGAAGGRLRALIKGHIFTALTLITRKQTGARERIYEAVMLAYPEGFVAPFAEEGGALLSVIDELLNGDAIDGYARRHLEEVHRAIRGAMARIDSMDLNARELEIVRHLADGLSNKVIARRMGITDHTVKFHLKKVFSKLKVSSRRAAVAKAVASNVLE
ncbi:LuxR C-terminal-related transcriptional regulator [Sphingosinicella xenopeptidilytica]|uniref:LuxR C-terminal-related transcriptional regulator n=1 Tax=Sphingosinicella xenopeptidilytica TaxID=364098 RepID=A0ABW3C378_SPHXN